MMYQVIVMNLETNKLILDETRDGLKACIDLASVYVIDPLLDGTAGVSKDGWMYTAHVWSRSGSYPVAARIMPPLGVYDPEDDDPEDYELEDLPF